MSRPSPPAPILANDFALMWQEIRDDAVEAVDRVGRSGWLILGEEVSGFEREIAAWWGVPCAVGLASGLDALEIGLRCAGVTPGSRVITTPLTAFATTLAIVRAGAEPLWCDVDQSGGLDLEQVDALLEADRSIRFVIPVHLYGHPLDPAALETIVERHEVALIEDCAQSAGAARDGRPTGTVGTAAASSLYPTKNLGAMGDGGILLTSDQALAERAMRLRNYGQRDRYEHVELGLNSRLDELHAAILRTAMLPRLDAWLQRRREIAAHYSAALLGSSLRPILPGGGESGHHLFAVETMDDPAAPVLEGLARRGIAAGRHYPQLCPDQPASQGLGRCAGPLPVARRIAEREISLPIHPQLDDRAVERVIEACLDVCG